MFGGFQDFSLRVLLGIQTPIVPQSGGGGGGPISLSVCSVLQTDLEGHMRQPDQISGPNETTGRPETDSSSYLPCRTARVALHQRHSYSGKHKEVGSVLRGAIHNNQSHQPHHGMT